MGIGLFCLLVPVQVFAANTPAAMCKRGHFNFSFGSNPGAIGDPTITAVWLDGGEKDKKFGLGRVTKVSPNGDLMMDIAVPTKEKPHPSVIIYTASLHQAVFIADPDPDVETSVAIGDCVIKDVPQKAKH